MSRDDFGDIICDSGCGASVIAYWDDTDTSIDVRAARRGWTRHGDLDLCPNHPHIPNTRATVDYAGETETGPAVAANDTPAPPPNHLYGGSRG